MSKVDALRALREARYAAASKAPAKAPARTAASAAPVAKAAPKAKAAATPSMQELTTDERCGHRNMGGKSCTRNAGHSEKNHRYS